MIYGPREEEELEVVWRLVEAGYGFARGTAGSSSPTTPVR